MTSAVEPNENVAVLFLTHVWNRTVAERFARLHRELAGYADCFVLLQDDGGPVRAGWAAFLERLGAPEAMQSFSLQTLEARLGYRYFKRDHLVPGSAHFPILEFARKRDYRHYWVIEFDVEYRGHWRALLAACQASPADLLVSHTLRPADWEKWPFWRTFRPPWWLRLLSPRWKSRRMRGLFPIARFSAEAIGLIDQAHRQGWRGHYEVLVPTVLGHYGRTVQNLAEVTQCFLGDDQQPEATPERQSTMRWRPEISREEFASRGNGPLLFHPVKGDWYYDGERIVEPPVG